MAHSELLEHIILNFYKREATAIEVQGLQKNVLSQNHSIYVKGEKRGWLLSLTSLLMPKISIMI